MLQSIFLLIFLSLLCKTSESYGSIRKLIWRLDDKKGTKSQYFVRTALHVAPADLSFKIAIAAKSVFIGTASVVSKLASPAIAGGALAGGLHAITGTVKVY